MSVCLVYKYSKSVQLSVFVARPLSPLLPSGGASRPFPPCTSESCSSNSHQGAELSSFWIY